MTKTIPTIDLSMTLGDMLTMDWEGEDVQAILPPILVQAKHFCYAECFAHPRFAACWRVLELLLLLIEAEEINDPVAEDVASLLSLVALFVLEVENLSPSTRAQLQAIQAVSPLFAQPVATTAE
jgi:hypothetical protein